MTYILLRLWVLENSFLQQEVSLKKDQSQWSVPIQQMLEMHDVTDKGK